MILNFLPSIRSQGRGESTMDLSVVIPLNDEADNVEPLVQEITEALDGMLEYEIICVDDGSNDQTLDRLQKLRPLFPRLCVVRYGDRCGKSAALLTGIRVARSPVIATIDGDLQNDPADIHPMLKNLSGIDGSADVMMVAGIRKRRQDTGWKKLTSKFANRFRRAMLNDSVQDTACGLKVFYRDMFLTLPYFENMHRFLPALVNRIGGRVVTVEVQDRPRIRGRTHYGTLDRLGAGIVDLFGVKWLQMRSKIPHSVEVFRNDEQ
jgi:dolichol-phosphate mannosyltransferase